jgi:hypothetical protein
VLSFAPNFSLSVIAGGLLATYLALMIGTVVLAALQTQLARTVGTTRGEIARLETAYYDAIASVNATDAHALGFVTPETIVYVPAARDTGLTLAR